MVCCLGDVQLMEGIGGVDVVLGVDPALPCTVH